MFNKIKKHTIVSAYKPVEFPADTAEDLAIALDVENIAKRMARQDLPPSDAHSVDAQELQLKQEMEKRAIQAKARIQQDANFKQMEISNLSLERDLADLSALPETFTNTINRLYQEKESELRLLKAQYTSALDDLQAFKRENGLRREADYPLSKVNAFGWLGLMLIGETILNSSFFSQGSDQGLLGGAFVALIISMLNVLIGWGTGFLFLRWKNHISSFRKFSGLFITFLAFLIAILGNLFVGHYRDAMKIDPDIGGALAVQNFFSGPFNLLDFYSWVLFALGTLVFSLALFKGYKWDDVYPGFGRVTRIVQNTKEDLWDAKNELTDEIQTIFEEHVESAEKHYKKMQTDKQQLELLFSSIKTDFDLYRSYLSNLKHAYQYLITLYRQSNKKERSLPSPAYFSEPIVISLDELTEVHEPIDRRHQFDNHLTKASSDFPEIKNKLLTEQASKIQIINEICKI